MIEPTTIATRLGFTEGPVLCADGSILIVSVDTGRVIRMDHEGAILAVHDVGAAPNGAAESADGTVYVAQAGGATAIARSGSEGSEGGIQVVHPDGSWAWCTTAPTSPNDLCFGPDGWIYLTDPTRPLGSGTGRLWRCDPHTGSTELLAETTWYPNGLAFGEDPSLLYVSDTDGARVVAFDLARPGVPPEFVTAVEHGRPDGLAIDEAGNLVIAVVQLADTGWGRLQVRSIEGRLLDDVVLNGHRLVTNVALGTDGTAIVTAADTGCVLRLDSWDRPGLALHPFR